MNQPSGETDLSVLLRSVAPKLLDDEYVFCSIKTANYGDFKELTPVATVKEAEGLTLVIAKRHADEHSLGYASVFRCISLAVHSSLEAVGLTAAVSATLTDKGISANVIAGYYHDHIFVQADKADVALVALNELSRS